MPTHVLSDAALDVATELRELIEAIDRRVPQLEREGEPAIARDAADLRQRAVRLLQALDRHHTID